MTGNTKFTIVGIGELLWDMLPNGKKLGGAPFNFAFHSCQAGLESFVVSAVGADKNGNEILDVLTGLGLGTDYIQKFKDYPTGTVSVKLDTEGMPDYIIHENVAWDNIDWNEKIEEIASKADAICFGSLAQRNVRSRETIAHFLNRTNEKCLRVFDINLRQQFYTKEIIHSSLLYANILKLNEEELPIIARLLDYIGTDEEILEQIIIDYHLSVIAFTKGSKESLIIDKTGISYCEVSKVNVVDTVGAGDSFTAVLVAGILNNIDLTIVHKIANNIAAYVCTQNGATPEIPENFLKQLRN